MEVAKTMVRELDSRPPIDETAESKGHVEVCGASSCDLRGNHTPQALENPASSAEGWRVGNSGLGSDEI